MLLKVTNSTIDDGTNGARSLGTGTHQAAVHGIDSSRGRRDEDNRPFRDAVDLIYRVSLLTVTQQMAKHIHNE